MLEEEYLAQVRKEKQAIREAKKSRRVREKTARDTALGKTGRKISLGSFGTTAVGEGTRAPGRFARAAQSVVKRLYWIHWFRALQRTAIPFALGSLLLLIVLRLMGLLWADWAGAIFLTGIWLVGCALWARLHSPAPFSALSAWDKAAGRKDVLASAHFFEQKEKVAQGEQLHLDRSAGVLEEAMPGMRAQLPLPRLTWQWALPLLVILFALTPFFKRVLDAAHRELDPGMIAIARSEGQDLANRDRNDQYDSLTEAEKKRMDELNKSIDKAAEKLKNAKGKTLAEIFQELSENAKAAEEFAKDLKDEGSGWLSDQMIEEMLQHADTADFGQQIRDKKAGASANEADVIADRLESNELTNQVSERMKDALVRIMKKATGGDRKHMIGRHMDTAKEKMLVPRPKSAAREFREIAKNLRRQEQREKVQEKLAELAKQLKDKGAKIANQNARGLQNKGKLSKNLKSLKNLAPRPANFNPLNQPRNNQLQMPQMMPFPGQNNPPPAGNQQVAPGNQQFAPVPGIAQPWRPGMKVPKLIPGNPNGGQFAPGGGQQPGGAGAGAPVPGAGAGAPAGLLGGLEAGEGTTGLGNQPTKPTDAARTSMVVTDINEQGESAMRSVVGSETTDSAARKYQETAKEFLKVEEAALDGQPLPASRRTHVRRYFNAIRKLIEEEG